MSNERIPFALFANCKLTKGYSRSTILDLQKHKIHLVPNSLFELITKYSTMTIETIKKDFNEESHQVIDEYFEFLLTNNLVLQSEDLVLFPPIDETWEHSTLINNCILDFSTLATNDFNIIAQQLDDLGCSFLSIRIYENYNIIQLEKYLKNFDQSTILGIEVLLPFNKLVSEDELSNFADLFKRIFSITIHSSKTKRQIESENLSTPIRFIESSIKNELSCGKINKEYFTTYLDNFIESQHHNTCLNRKISIDAEGNIKNCPSMAKSYGNIKDTKLIDVVNNPDFQKVWHIKKDEITKCKDCEFRHICTDCRAYIENPDDQFSPPLKCGYNPYTCEWEEWSTNPLKQKAIEYYGMQEFVKK